jgi:hypothetical protein
LLIAQIFNTTLFGSLWIRSSAMRQSNTSTELLMLAVAPEYGQSTLVLPTFYLTYSNSHHSADEHPETEVIGVDMAPVQPNK